MRWKLILFSSISRNKLCAWNIFFPAKIPCNHNGKVTPSQPFHSSHETRVFWFFESYFTACRLCFFQRMIFPFNDSLITRHNFTPVQITLNLLFGRKFSITREHRTDKNREPAVFSLRAAATCAFARATMNPRYKSQGLLAVNFYHFSGTYSPGKKKTVRKKRYFFHEQRSWVFCYSNLTWNPGTGIFATRALYTFRVELNWILFDLISIQIRAFCWEKWRSGKSKLNERGRNVDAWKKWSSILATAVRRSQI